jgi:hypothetical protein
MQNDPQMPMTTASARHSAAAPGDKPGWAGRLDLSAVQLTSVRVTRVEQGGQG